MLRPGRHLLRDVIVLSLPAVALLVYLVLATATSFYNAEIKNFHGYLTRNIRLSGPAGTARTMVRPVTDPTHVRHLPLPESLQARPARHFDLRVPGTSLDLLSAALPASGSVWQPAEVMDDGILKRVQVRYRGRMFSNFFGRRKTWKVKTRRRGLIDGFRIINLTPLEDVRLEDHLSFFAARRIGLPTPRTSVVHLYVNRKDQGLYLQEEQVDESMIRRCGRMPGDVFYGELIIPGEPKLGSNDLFWNPFLWRKKASNNRHTEEYRPYLCDLLDHIADPSLESYDRFYGLLHTEEFAQYLAVLSYYGDQHVDRSHNHKLYFDPLAGKFEPIIWNVTSTMPRGHGVESFANALFLKLCRDPRFLDRVQEILQERILEANMTAQVVDEANRVLKVYGDEALDPDRFRDYVGMVCGRVRARGEAYRRFRDVAQAAFDGGEAGRLTVWARSLASLRLDRIELEGDAAGVRLFEDRDFDGQPGPRDREIAVRAEGNVLRLEGGSRLYVGRDFRAPYHEPDMEQGDTFSQYRLYTKLAFLESRYLLVGAGSRVTGVGVSRTVGSGGVALREGPPDGYVATESIHPWRFPAPPAPRTLRFRGEVKLESDLVLEEGERFEAEPGTRFLLGPGVSIVLRGRVDLERIRVERLDPKQPWGVFALQGRGCDGSVIADSVFTGGSHDEIRYVYYSGMVSIYHAHEVALTGCRFSDNLLGDDTVRFGHGEGIRVEHCVVERANGDAIDCDLSSGVISDTTVTDARNDGIDLMTATVDLFRNRISGAGDKGISFGEGADPEVADVAIRDCVIGIGLKDASNPTLRNVEIRGCRVGISSYDKNWRYPGGGRGTLVGCHLADNGRDLVMDRRSTLRMERCNVGAGFVAPPEALAEGRLELLELAREPAR